MWSSAKDWSAGMVALLVVGSLNLMALPRVHILFSTSSWSTRSQQSSGSDYRAGLLPGSCSLHPQLSPLWRTPTLVKPTDTELPKGPRGHLPLTSSSGITDPRWLLLPAFDTFDRLFPRWEACTGRSSCQLSPEPASAPPATRSVGRWASL